MPARNSVSPRTDKPEEGEEGPCWPEQAPWADAPPSAALVEEQTRESFAKLLRVTRDGKQSFFEFEQLLIPLVFGLGRLLLALFLVRRHERLETVPSEVVDGDRYERKVPQGRWLGTFFGKVRYWRTYMYGPERGYFPLDRELGLPADGFSTHLIGLMARLATKMSYAAAKVMLRSFLSWSPSTTTIEHAVLGLGRRTQAWFEHAPAPKDDGEVLVIEIDGKSPPTATEAELRKRRGKRKPARVPGSPRHRGGKREKGKAKRKGKAKGKKRKRRAKARAVDSARHRSREKRKRRRKKTRRKKGDKSKNGRMVTVVVMYTLKKGVDRDGNEVLIGPINRRLYASYGPKRHAFAIARREADKRGFQRGSGKTVQLVTDGDEDLERYGKEFFPEAIHTLDIFHVVEHLWAAGRSLHREGSKALEEWVDEQRQRLYSGHVRDIVRDLQGMLSAIPLTGPGNKGKRKRLQAVITYMDKRVHMMNYKELLERDLEICSGSVEGAVRYVVSQRFDCAGMRWIRERAEALLQLRCIEINGDWDAFMAFVHATGPGRANAPPFETRLLASESEQLPTLGVAA
jgi:hypothetical protein